MDTIATLPKLDFLLMLLKVYTISSAIACVIVLAAFAFDVLVIQKHEDAL